MSDKNARGELSRELLEDISLFIDKNYIENFMGSFASQNYEAFAGKGADFQVNGEVFSDALMSPKEEVCEETQVCEEAAREESICDDVPDKEEGVNSPSAKPAQVGKAKAYKHSAKPAKPAKMNMTGAYRPSSKPAQVGKADGGKKDERSLDEVVSQLSETFQERLFRLIDASGLTDVELYKKANLDRKHFSKIRSNPDYKPKKITVLALAVALELGLDETKDLLSRAGYALSPSSKFDLIIEYFVGRKIYDLYTINLALFHYKQPMLGE
ncbi:MAG: hypothetical protein IJM37_05570 [Lachnospiraceae bacterium]|nr:hypothetical protein [Lachnospiraceae bacterium]